MSKYIKKLSGAGIEGKQNSKMVPWSPCSPLIDYIRFGGKSDFTDVINVTNQLTLW
jgi:hypothetical protein